MSVWTTNIVCGRPLQSRKTSYRTLPFSDVIGQVGGGGGGGGGGDVMFLEGGGGAPAPVYTADTADSSNEFSFSALGTTDRFLLK